MSCTNSVASEDFADFIAPYFTTPEEFIRSQGTDCIDFVNSTLAVVYVPLSTVTPSTYTSYTYSAVPKLYSLLDVTSMDAAGITPAGELPVLNNQGAGVIVGFVDTGINYTDSLFRNVDGSTRIIGIWDQTNNSDNSNNIENETAKPFSAFSALYGTQYTAEEINLALNSDNPASIVPTRDENGHGTFLASIAAGNRDERAGFSGAAPQASIAMVKLKPAKQYLRDFYLIQDGAEAYQENDIMMGIKYLRVEAYRLKKPMVSYYEHALQKGEGILRRIEAGESCALCSDAGMPCVSDPGEVIVRDALARGIKVVPVPAASACVTALAVSGQDTSRWVFEGFLPVNRKQKKERLAELLQEKRTTIFYEAPHKLRTTLDDLANAFGADRSITLCRELTKLHEDIWKTTLGEAVEHYKTNEPRGEYVLVMAGAPETADPEQELTLEQAAHRALELTGQGFGPTAAAKAAAQGTPYSKSEVYKQLLVLQQGQQAGE